MSDDVTDDERELLRLLRRVKARTRRRARLAAPRKTVDAATREAMERVHGVDAYEVEAMLSEAELGPLIVPRSMRGLW
jgi:hypothetical protein